MTVDSVHQRTYSVLDREQKDKVLLKIRNHLCFKYISKIREQVWRTNTAEDEICQSNDAENKID